MSNLHAPISLVTPLPPETASLSHTAYKQTTYAVLLQIVLSSLRLYISIWSNPSKLRVFCLCVTLSQDFIRFPSNFLEASRADAGQRDSAGKNHQCMTSRSENTVKHKENINSKLYSALKTEKKRVRTWCFIFTRVQLYLGWGEMHSYIKAAIIIFVSKIQLRAKMQTSNWWMN